jgi:hypothetical protein
MFPHMCVEKKGKTGRGKHDIPSLKKMVVKIN